MVAENCRIAYFIFLTLLLLTKDPARLIGAGGAAVDIAGAAPRGPYDQLLAIGLFGVDNSLAGAALGYRDCLGGLRRDDGDRPGLCTWENAGLGGLASGFGRHRLGSHVLLGRRGVGWRLACRRRSQQQPQTEPAVDCAVTRKLL